MTLEQRAASALAAVRRYRANNPHVGRLAAKRRRAAKLQACPAWADHKKIAAIYTEAERLSTETGVPHEVDHIYPLRGRDGSRGLHVHENLRVVPKSINRAKGNKPSI